MEIAERTRIAFTGGTPDRVPIHGWLGMPLIRELLPQKTIYELLELWIDDPLNSIVKMQLDLGLDPMIVTISQHIGEIEIWPRMLLPRSRETGAGTPGTVARRASCSARARAPGGRPAPRRWRP